MIILEIKTEATLWEERESNNWEGACDSLNFVFTH